MSLEELIPSNQSKSHMYAILIRTALVISTLFVGLTIPFFGKSSHSTLIVAMFGSLLPFVSLGQHNLFIDKNEISILFLALNLSFN